MYIALLLQLSIVLMLDVILLCLLACAFAIRAVNKLLTYLLIFTVERHRLFAFIQLYLVLPSPSSSSWIWNLLSTFLSADLFQMFFGRPLLWTCGVAVRVWQCSLCCHNFLSVCIQASSSSSFFFFVLLLSWSITAFWSVFSQTWLRYVWLMA